MNGQRVSYEAYDVVVDGKRLPGHAAEEVHAALVRRFRLNAATASNLLDGGREVVKRGLEEAKAETYVAALRECGVVARAVPSDGAATVPSRGGPPSPGEEPSLAVDYAAAYVAPRKPVHHQAIPNAALLAAAGPSAWTEPRRSRSGTGWWFLLPLALSAVTFFFGEHMGTGVSVVAFAGFGMGLIGQLWLFITMWRESPMWAIAGFFFWPANLVFAIVHWAVAKGPVVVTLLGGLMLCSSAIAGLRMSDPTTVDCGEIGSFSYDDGDGCVCQAGYEWCGADENDHACCPIGLEDPP